jgi:putative endonuclease
MFTVYAIQSLSTKRIYIGQTKDLNKRLQYHNLGYVKSTSKNRPWELIAFEKVKSISEARWMERQLKKSGGKRIKWIGQKRLQ